jgi:CheY-like chemotaxis protein
MHRPTVLLVDSDDDNSTMYALYLQARGFQVTTSSTAEEATLKASRADVVVTGIPIIVLTACAFDAEYQRARAAGCNAFLPKPCLPDRLENEIRSLLSSGGTPRNRPGRALPIVPTHHRKAS